MLDDILFPGVQTTNWQMLFSERLALTGLLARVRPRYSLEIGTYYGGSLTLIAQFSDRVWAVDVDPEVPARFRVPPNVDIRIGPPEELVEGVLTELEAKGVALNFILIDADHSSEGVRRDIETVIHRPVPPREPCFILMHDSGNPACRKGIMTANWEECPYVQLVELDFVAGQIIEHTVTEDRGEVWGGLAMAYISPRPRQHPFAVHAGSGTTIAALHRCAADLRLLKECR